MVNKCYKNDSFQFEKMSTKIVEKMCFSMIFHTF